MFQRIKTKTVVVAAFGLLIAIATGNVGAADQPPQFQSSGMSQALSSPPPLPSQLHADENCDCLRCRAHRCWLARQMAIYHHDKAMFHWYIRGNGPAIHTRPAAICWW